MMSFPISINCRSNRFDGEVIPIVMEDIVSREFIVMVSVGDVDVASMSLSHDAKEGF
jgi:hypothetical protein